MPGSRRLRAGSRATSTEPSGENLVAAGTPRRARLPGRATVPTGGRGGRHMAHRTDEASVVPAEPQRLQEPVPSIDLEIAAAAFGAEHLLIVCEERQSPGQRSPAPQHRSPSSQGNRAAARLGSHRHSLGTTHCQPWGDDARDTRARCLCRAGWPRPPPGCREEANLISQDAALAFDVHPPSSPWQHRSNGTTRQPGGPGWRAQGCGRGYLRSP